MTWPTRVLVALVSGWRLVSRLTPPRCRFAPSCSTYAVEALRSHGARRGTGLALRRVLRCHPFHPGGVDPVPLHGVSQRTQPRWEETTRG